MQSAPIDFAALAVSRPSAQIMKLMRQRIEHYLAARSNPSADKVQPLGEPLLDGAWPTVNHKAPIVTDPPLDLTIQHVSPFDRRVVPLC